MARDRKRYAHGAAEDRGFDADASSSVLIRNARRPSSTRPQDDMLALHRALETVAKLVLTDPVYAPIFRRLEEEIRLERQAQADNILDRARAIAGQNAIGARSAATWNSDPPCP